MKALVVRVGTPGWEAELAHTIGRMIAERRHDLGLSAQALSDECGRAGIPVPRTTIANIENGRKTSIPLHELMAMAGVLGVSFTVSQLCVMWTVQP